MQEIDADTRPDSNPLPFSHRWTVHRIFDFPFFHTFVTYMFLMCVCVRFERILIVRIHWLMIEKGKLKERFQPRIYNINIFIFDILILYM